MTDLADVWATPLEQPGTDEWRHVPSSARAVANSGERLTGLVAWTGCGFALAAALLLFPIGLLALPIPFAIGIALINRGRTWPDVLGLAAGVSAFLAYVAYRSRDSNPCADAPTTVVLRPGEEFRCSGTAPEPWLIAALLVLAVAAAMYALALIAEHHNRR